jgi:hypothetical protein
MRPAETTLTCELCGEPAVYCDSIPDPTARGYPVWLPAAIAVLASRRTPQARGCDLACEPDTSVRATGYRPIGSRPLRR